MKKFAKYALVVAPAIAAIGAAILPIGAAPEPAPKPVAAPAVTPKVTAAPAATPKVAAAPAGAPTVSMKAAPAASLGSIVPLFGPDTKLEPALIIDTPEALITRWADRGRDRHARENMFHAYGHFIALYWIDRTHSMEIVDKVAKGGKTITYNIRSLVPLNGPNIRLFFEGKGTVAQYMNNNMARQVGNDPLSYSFTLSENNAEKRPLKIGDRIEIEFSPFIKPPFQGRTNYYGTAFLYVVGTPGQQPWEGRGKMRDSFPIPNHARLGGMMTVHEPNSDEPKEVYKQMGTNIAPINAQPFVLGRRIFHTNMQTGEHTEPGNPVFKEQVGKLGPRFAEKACISCHVNDGRSLPPKTGTMLTQYAMHVGIDATGTPDPKLGYMLQPQTIDNGPSEGSVSIAKWEETAGTYPDGTKYSLRKPVYEFKGTTPKFHSIRVAPQLVGHGLLEAVDEKDILARVDANDANGDGIKGKAQIVTDPTGKTRLGRFGYKAGQASLKDQIAAAFTNDMGVTNSVYPNQDRGSAQPEVKGGEKLNDKDLDDVYRYVATLGVNPQRNYADTDVVKGQKLFASANCTGCHVDEMKTSKYSQLADLREQTIKPYTDVLLHDMGPGLADNMGEGKATGAEWRTAPLWGIGYTKGTAGGEAYLHDGRARTLEEAILWHGGEAQKSLDSFKKLPKEDRDAVIKFIQSL